MSTDFGAVVRHAAQFENKVRSVKRALGSVDFEWYRYDTFANVAQLDRLLTGANRRLLGDRKLRIVDIGCQDGELSFLLESLGHSVTALDYPAYSHNGMRGLRTLKSALGSSVEIHEVDLDRQFTFPHDRYDLAVFLGVLYHLRNPFYALEEIARKASACLLSTRVAQRFPDGTKFPVKAAMAYLLKERELNEDDSNYFIFSEAGLRVMLERTHWDVCEYAAVGETAKSDPVHPNRDARVFCFLKSRYDRLSNLELLEGWHESEDTGWRWAGQTCSARAQWNEPFPPQRLTVELFLPAELLARVNPLRVSVSVNGRELPAEVYTAPGAHTLVRAPGPAAGGKFLLRFQVNGTLPPDENDPRERGLVIASIRLD